MKRTSFVTKLQKLAFVCVCLSSALLTACSNDDDELDIENGDYFEITFDGETYREELLSVYTELPVDDGLAVTNDMADSFKGFDAFHSLIHYDNFDDLVNAKPGTYDVVSDPVYEGPYENFTFSLIFDGKGTHFNSISGRNKVTSVKKTGENAVAVEGSYDVLMSNESYSNSYDSTQTFRAKGKYRMTIFCN